ncbi:MAG: methylated-DNA--[protein]-cysteine S-methyltransferase [Actinomycetales bacterium]|nr:methylated-DNA--[protein]-cysteine S-methyltransferase [Actinomycetales bacterium]
MTGPAEDPLRAALRGLRADVSPPLIDGGDLRFVVEDTPVGQLLLAARLDGTLLTSSFVGDDAEADSLLDRLAQRVSPRVLRGGEVLDAPRRQLDEYLTGRRRAFGLELDLTLATPFQRLVLDRLTREVGYGTTVSYSGLAVALGRPGSARAVGAALGANPLCVVLPCHRVVAASGALTGYAGGITAKRYLLDLEAAGTAGSPE